MKIVAERLVEKISETEFKFQNRTHRITISVGGATFPDDAIDPKALFIKADENLKKSRESEKNETVI